MVNAFRPISGLIEVDFPWREAKLAVLLYPSSYAPQDSRIVFHETVHYWQQLGQGFMAKMVEEDWSRLHRFEQTHKSNNPNPYRIEFVRRHAKSSFSAHDLHEALARFWDVHVIGPHRLIEMDFLDPKRRFDDFFKHQYFAFKKKGAIVHPEHGGYSDLAFDMAMAASAGSYAKPYQYVRERFGALVAGVVFPLAGYFSLQTERPIDVFLEVIEAVLPSMENLPKGHAIHNLWKAYFSIVRHQAIQVAKRLGIGNLSSTAIQVESGALHSHPVYKWSFLEMERGCHMLKDTNLAYELASIFDGGLPGSLRGKLALDFCLCCPGDTTNRNFLAQWISPPCIRFSREKERTWLFSELYRSGDIQETDYMEKVLSKKAIHIAKAAIDIQERWMAFRRFSRGY